MRRTKAEAEQTRRLLLETALKVFSRQGYAATTLDDIAREAAVTRGAIYHHFGGKAELYAAVLKEHQAPAGAQIGAALAADMPPLARLRELMIHSLSRFEEDAGYRATMELILFRSEALPELPPELGAGLADKTRGQAELRQQLAALLAEAVERGEARPDLDTEAAALTIVALLNGLALTWLLDQRAFSIAALAPRVVDTYLRGIVAGREP